MNYRDNLHTDILHKHPHQECSNCVMDTSDPWITFDNDGMCNHCHGYQDHMDRIGTPAERKVKLDRLVSTLKQKGQGKEYDCIMGLSGGVDSSYLTWFAVKKLALRPLVVHVDTGWNSELAVNNIQNIVQRLNLDLHTLVVDWEEIRDLQRSYFLSGIANLDVPQDHSFIAALYNEASNYGIKDVLNGGNMQTESILPNAWGYDASDAVSLKSIHKRFGRHKLKNYPTIGFFQRHLFYPHIYRMTVHRPLEYIEYDKHEAKALLMSELGWRDYGGKHYESVFTKFFQAHYLPTKFGYDKRLAHLASLIVSGQMTKAEAKEELKKPLYDPKELDEDRIYWVKKIGLTMEEYERVMAEKPRFYTDYDNSEKMRDNIRTLVRRWAKIIRRFFPKRAVT